MTMLSFIAVQVVFVLRFVFVLTSLVAVCRVLFKHTNAVERWNNAKLYYLQRVWVWAVRWIRLLEWRRVGTAVRRGGCGRGEGEVVVGAS